MHFEPCCCFSTDWWILLLLTSTTESYYYMLESISTIWRSLVARKHQSFRPSMLPMSAASCFLACVLHGHWLVTSPMGYTATTWFCKDQENPLLLLELRWSNEQNQTGCFSIAHSFHRQVNPSSPTRNRSIPQFSK